MKLTALEIKIIECGLINPQFMAYRLAKQLKITGKEAVKEVDFYHGTLLEEIINDEKLCPFQQNMLADIGSNERFSNYAKAHLGRDFLGKLMTQQRATHITTIEKHLHQKLISHIESPQFQRGEYAEA